MRKPIVDARHLDGNIFIVAGAVRRALARAGRHGDSVSVIGLMTTSKSYNEALARFAELVDFDFGGGVGGDDNDDDMEDGNDN